MSVQLFAGSPKTPPTRGGWCAPGQGPRRVRSSSPKDGGGTTTTTTHLVGVRVFIWICGACRGFRPALAWAPRMRDGRGRRGRVVEVLRGPDNDVDRAFGNNKIYRVVFLNESASVVLCIIDSGENTMWTIGPFALDRVGEKGGSPSHGVWRRPLSLERAFFSVSSLSSLAHAYTP